MATATPFKALGAGNGFPSILPRVNVSQYDNYETLSLEQAMMLYWNLLSATSGLLTASMSTSNNDGGSDSLNKSKSNQIFSITPEPKERLEKFPSISPKGGSFFTTTTQNEEAEFFRVGSAGGSGSVSVPAIRKLYNGVTTNEANFIGYGIARLYFASASAGVDEITSCSAQLTIGSYLDGEDENSTSTGGDGLTTTIKQNAGVVNIGGMSFRSLTRVVSSGLQSHTSPTLTAGQSSASASDSFTITNTAEDGSTTTSSHSSSAKVTAPSLGFHSYQ